MVAIAVLLGTAGYGLIYYGTRLWVKEPETLAYAFGFTAVNTAGKPASAASLGLNPPSGAGVK